MDELIKGEIPNLDTVQIYYSVNKRINLLTFLYIHTYASLEYEFI